MAKDTDFSFFLAALKAAQTSEAFTRLSQQYVVGAANPPEYSKEIIEAIKGKDAKASLDFIEGLYTLDVRDNNPGRKQEHLVETLIKIGWQEGLQEVLQRRPELINIPVFDEKQNVTPLLSDVLFHCKNEKIVEILLNANPNLALVDSAYGKNIVHELAVWNYTASNWMMEHVLRHAPLEVLTAENDYGQTPHETAKGSFFSADFLEKYNDIVRNRFPNKMSAFRDIKRLPYESIKKMREKSKQYLNESYEGRLPSPPPAALLQSIIGKMIRRSENGGKPLNTLLFPDVETLSRYLNEWGKKSQDDLIANAIVMVQNGAHSVNVFCIKHDNLIKVLIIDGGGEINSYSNDLKDAMLTQVHTLDDENVLHLKTTIHYRRTGCRLLTAYFAAKLSRLSPTDANELHDELKPKANKDGGGLALSDFPLWLGMMSVTQSMTAIRNAQDKISESDLSAPINKRNETIEQVLERGKSPMYCPGYHGLEPDEKLVNTTLERKGKHLRAHADCTDGLSDEEMMQAMAQVLGLDVSADNWQQELKKIEETLGNWSDFAKKTKHSR